MLGPADTPCSLSLATVQHSASVALRLNERLSEPQRAQMAGALLRWRLIGRTPHFFAITAAAALNPHTRRGERCLKALASVLLYLRTTTEPHTMAQVQKQDVLVSFTKDEARLLQRALEVFQNQQAEDLEIMAGTDSAKRLQEQLATAYCLQRRVLKTACQVL